MVRFLSALQAWAVSGLAIVAGLLIVSVFLTVIFDVAVRVLGYQPSTWPIPISEYSLLYITMLGGPWLLRKKGHIVVESLRVALPGGGKRATEIFAYLVSALTCFAIAWFAGDLVESVAKGYEDARAIVVPKAGLYLPMFLCFFLMGIDFCRFLFGAGSLYAGGDAPAERI